MIPTERLRRDSRRSCTWCENHGRFGGTWRGTGVKALSFDGVGIAGYLDRFLSAPDGGF
jgi:hypothetical protein